MGFQLLIWIGAVVTLVGIGGLMATAYAAYRIRQSGQSDEAMRSALQKAVARNMAALFVAVFGLMMVIIGLALR